MLDIFYIEPLKLSCHAEYGSFILTFNEHVQTFQLIQINFRFVKMSIFPLLYLQVIDLKKSNSKIWNSKSKMIFKINREWKYNLRDVENPVKYLWWSFFAKIVNSFQQLTFLKRSSITDVWWCPKQAFDSDISCSKFSNWILSHCVSQW